jgi:hypothetical protein
VEDKLLLRQYMLSGVDRYFDDEDDGGGDGDDVNDDDDVFVQVRVRPAPYLELPYYTYARLVIACKYRPLPILKQALFVLQPSSPFVVFHEFLEPLVDCYLYLQAHNLALRMVLSDTWHRYAALSGCSRVPCIYIALFNYVCTILEVVFTG